MDLTQRKIYYCKVIQIKQTYVLVEFENKTGICHISEVSDYLINNLHDFFKINKSYYFSMLDSNDKNNVYRFSYKKINPELMKWHYAAIPTISGFKNIYKQTIELLKSN